MHAEGRRPHLLYVTWGFPPSRSSSAYRTLATANAFAAAGWDVTVLTVDRRILAERYGMDVSLEERIDPRVRVLRLRFDEPMREVDISLFSRARVASETTWHSAVRRLSSLPFPEPVYGPWRRHLTAAAEQVHRRHPVDLTIGSAGPNVSFTAGHHLHRRHGVPYVMDYRDSWALDLYRDRRATEPASRAGRWENRLLAEAAEVWFVNEPIRTWYTREFPGLDDRAHVVANGFDGDVGAAVAAAERRLGRDRPRDPSDGLTFCYLGTLYGGMPLAEVLAGWREARRRDEVMRRSRFAVYGHVGHGTGGGSAFGDMLHAHAADGVEYLGPVTKSQTPQVYASADALVLLLAPGKYVTSGKVFEYAATGLPVLSLHDPASPATAILRDSPVWTATKSMAPEDVAEAFVAGARLAATTTPDIVDHARGWAARYSRARQLGPRVEELGRLVSRTAPAATSGGVTSEGATSGTVRTAAARTVTESSHPVRRIVLVVGQDAPADEVLARASGSRGIAELIEAAGDRDSLVIDLLCAHTPTGPIPGVRRVHVLDRPGTGVAGLAEKAVCRPRAASLARRAAQSVPGRVLLSLSPADPGRSAWRAAAADDTAGDFVRGADLLVAVDLAAVRTCWRWVREGRVGGALSGLAAARLRLARE